MCFDIKYLIPILLPITVYATNDITTYVKVTQYDHGAWRFTNTTNRYLRCNMGLTTYLRNGISIPSKSPDLSHNTIIPSTTGSRNFSLDPYGSYVYDRPNMGTVYCEISQRINKYKHNEDF